MLNKNGCLEVLQKIPLQIYRGEKTIILLVKILVGCLTCISLIKHIHDLCKNRIALLHYLDDFFGGHSDYKIAERQFGFAIKKLTGVGMKVHLKQEPAVRNPILLGIRYNLPLQIVEIPKDKINNAIKICLVYIQE